MRRIGCRHPRLQRVRPRSESELARARSEIHRPSPFYSPPCTNDPMNTDLSTRFARGLPVAVVIGAASFLLVGPWAVEKLVDYGFSYEPTAAQGLAWLVAGLIVGPTLWIIDCEEIPPRGAGYQWGHMGSAAVLNLHTARSSQAAISAEIARTSATQLHVLAMARMHRPPSKEPHSVTCPSGISRSPIANW